MRRRTFMRDVVLGLLGVPLAAGAQQASTIPRIGLLSPASPLSPPSPSHEAFRQGLQELGYMEGRNITIEFRSAEGKPERLPALAAELVRLKVAVIVTYGELGARAARDATATIPIVMAVIGDPVATGFVASLARPGGNMTGLTNLASGLERKRLELLRQAVPRTNRVAVLRYPPDHVLDPIYWAETQLAAKAFSVRLQSVEIEDIREFESAFAAMRREGAGALLVLPSPFFYFNRDRIAELEVRNHVPAMHEAREFVEAGSLMSYGPSVADLLRRAASYVDKILRGAKPGDLPIEQPTKFELVINLKTANALGLTIPQPLLLRANEVIQ